MVRGRNGGPLAAHLSLRAAPALQLLWAAAALGAFVVEDGALGEGADRVHLKTLRNKDTGEYLQVVVDSGGKTEALVLRSPQTGKLVEVLLDHHGKAADIRANVGWKGAVLIPYANRVKNGTYSINGRRFFLERNEDRTPHGKQGLHGYLYKKELQVVSQHADSDTAELTLSYDFDGTDAGYPFPLSVALTYRLDSGGFSLRTAARNRAESGGPLPFCSSWHSYFRVSQIASAVVELDPCSRWNHVDVSNASNVHSDLIPTGLATPDHRFDGRSPVGGSSASPTYYDDEFKAVAPVEKCRELKARVRDPETQETAVLWGDESHRWFQVFTGTKRNFGEDGIAVEAMNCEADAWNNGEGLRLLQAGEEWTGELGVYLESNLSAEPSARRAAAGAAGVEVDVLE